MKTPDEVKKGLECMSNSDIECDYCPYRDDSYLFCSTGIVKDAIACIQQLETERHQLLTKIQQLERERDALLGYLADTHYVHCSICKHNTGEGVMGCKRIREVKGPCFEWRGVKEE